MLKMDLMELHSDSKPDVAGCLFGLSPNGQRSVG